MSKTRTFTRDTNKTYRELIQINDAENTIKIYAQSKEIGFPFDEYTTSLSEYGYKSSDDFFKSVSRREKENLNRVRIKEIDTDIQTKSEIDGLLNLAKYRKEHGRYTSLILNDGTLKNDIIDRLSAYGYTTAEAIKAIENKFAEV